METKPKLIQSITDVESEGQILYVTFESQSQYYINNCCFVNAALPLYEKKV